MFIVPSATEFQHLKGVQHEDNNLYNHHDYLHMHSLPTRRTYRHSRVGMCSGPLRRNLRINK